MKKILLTIALLLLSSACGCALYRHFVTDQIMDRGGMENPDAALEQEQPLDGEQTYVANDLLLERLVGAWESADGRWKMTLRADYGVVVTLDGETALEDTLEFSYLQPGEVLQTELMLASGKYEIRRADGNAATEIVSLEHEAVEGDEHGRITLVLTGEKAKEETVEFRQPITK